MGGSKVKFPGPTPQEQALQSMQLEMLNEQRANQAERSRMEDLLLPHLLESSGLTPQFQDGKIVGFSKTGDDLAGMRKEIERKLLERSMAALSGNAPVDPGLERGIGESQRLLESRLQQQLGPGYAVSTPGIQALAEGAQRGEELRYGARTGQLTLAEQLGLSREQAEQQRRQANVANIGSIFGLQGQRGSGTTQALGSLAQALQGYGAQRQGQFQASIFNAQQPGPLDFVGNILGIGAGAFAGGLGTLGARRLFG